MFFSCKYCKIFKNNIFSDLPYFEIFREFEALFQHEKKK